LILIDAICVNHLQTADVMFFTNSNLRRCLGEAEVGHGWYGFIGR